MISIDLLQKNLYEKVSKYKRLIIYGYGFYGIMLERIVKDVSNIEIIRVDDMFQSKDIQKFDNLDPSKDTLIIVCIYDRTAIMPIMEKCVSRGFDTFDFVELLRESATDGILPAKSDIAELLKEIGYGKINKNMEISCYICNKTAKEIYINMKDFHIAECQSCGHRFITNMPDDEEIESYYNENLTYYTGNYKKKFGDDGLKNSQNNWYVKTRMDRLSKFIDLHDGKPLNILEIGCLDGILVYHLKSLGHNAIGIEMNRPVAEYFSKFLEIDIRVGDLESAGFERESFDVIYSSHVLEHTSNPKEIITKAKSLLKQNGALISDLPCNEKGFENYHHLHFFSEASIIKLHNDAFGNYKHYLDKPTKLDGFDYNTACIISIKQ